MKTFLLLLLVSALPCLADLPCTYDDIVTLYGPPSSGTARYHSAKEGSGHTAHGSLFDYQGISIKITTGSEEHIRSISYSRPTAFNDIEIADLLKPLSTEESWVKKGDKDWTLPANGAKAHWDGEGRLTITTSLAANGTARPVAP